MRLGISSYTFGWAVGAAASEHVRPLDEHGLLDQARAFGVKVLQIGDNLPLHTFDDARLTRLAERAARDGVQIEVGTRRVAPDRVAEYVRIAHRLNAKLIRIVTDEGNFHPSKEQVIGALKDCVPLLDGVLLGLENHDRFTAAELRDIIETAGSDRIGICLDTANSLGAGEGIDAVAATLAPFVLNLHIKDFQIERVPHLMGFTVTGRPAGSGFLHLPRLLEALAPATRCETAILELWTPPESTLEQTIAREAAWAEQSIRYLKPFFTL